MRGRFARRDVMMISNFEIIRKFGARFVVTHSTGSGHDCKRWYLRSMIDYEVIEQANQCRSLALRFEGKADIPIDRGNVCF
jgi:hypothetical protein